MAAKEPGDGTGGEEHGEDQAARGQGDATIGKEQRQVGDGAHIDPGPQGDDQTDGAQGHPGHGAAARRVKAARGGAAPFAAVQIVAGIKKDNKKEQEAHGNQGGGGGEPEAEDQQAADHRSQGKTKVAAGGENGGAEAAARAADQIDGHHRPGVEGGGAQARQAHQGDHQGIAGGKAHQPHGQGRPQHPHRYEPAGAEAIGNHPKNRLDHRGGDVEQHHRQPHLEIVEVEDFLELGHDHRQGALAGINGHMAEKHQEQWDFFHDKTR